MPTNKGTIEALVRISEALKALGVKSKDLIKMNQHIGQQQRQIAWVKRASGHWHRVSKAINVHKKT